MKKSLLTPLFLCILTFTYAQRIEITPFGGFLATARVQMYDFPGNYYGQYAKVDDLANYGLRLGLDLDPQFVTTVEFEWNHTNSNFTYLDLNDQEVSLPFSANYYMIGVLKELRVNSFEPYAILNLGMVNFRNTNSTEYNINRFAVGAGIGAKVFLTDNLGLRFQGRLLAPFRFQGITFGCGIGTGGGGCGTGISSYSATIQADLTGGIILILDNP